MRLSRRVPNEMEPNPWTRRLSERRASGATLLDLTQMNPTRVGLGEPENVKSAWLAALADPRAMGHEPDPRGLLAAREAVARYYADRAAPVDPERIVLTTGTSESYSHLFRLLADPGDRVLVPAPSYPLFEPIARVEGIEVDTYRLAYDGAWHLDVGSVETACARSASPVRAIVVVQPNLPTGSCLHRGEVAALEDACARHDAALISDEVFSDFPWPLEARRKEAGEGRTLLSLLAPRRVPTFVLGGLSKACGLPQLKLGWIAATGPEPETDRLLDGLEWIADLFLSVGTPVQLALPRLLEGRRAFQASVQERIAANLSSLRRWVRDHPEVELLEAEGGWAAILRMPSRRSGEAWSLGLLDRDVMTHPDLFYDLEVPSLVLSLIVEPAVLRSGLEELLTIL